MCSYATVYYYSNIVATDHSDRLFAIIKSALKFLIYCISTGFIPDKIMAEVKLIRMFWRIAAGSADDDHRKEQYLKARQDLF